MWKPFGAFTSLLRVPRVEIAFLSQHPFLREGVYERGTKGCTKGMCDRGVFVDFVRKGRIRTPFRTPFRTLFYNLDVPSYPFRAPFRGWCFLGNLQLTLWNPTCSVTPSVPSSFFSNLFLFGHLCFMLPSSYSSGDLLFHNVRLGEYKVDACRQQVGQGVFHGPQGSTT